MLTPFQSAKVLSLNPHIPPDRITAYHCFYCGITLLQCLAIDPTALTHRRAHQAMSACLSALSVYTRVLPAVAPFLRLFEELSNLLVCGAETNSSLNVRDILNRVVSSDPSETPGYVAGIPLAMQNSKCASQDPAIIVPTREPASNMRPHPTDPGNEIIGMEISQITLFFSFAASITSPLLRKSNTILFFLDSLL